MVNTSKLTVVDFRFLGFNSSRREDTIALRNELQRYCFTTRNSGDIHSTRRILARNRPMSENATNSRLRSEKRRRERNKLKQRIKQHKNQLKGIQTKSIKSHNQLDRLLEHLAGNKKTTEQCHSRECPK